MSPQTTLLACLAIPLFGAALIVLLRHRPNAREAASLLTATCLFAMALRLLPALADGPVARVTLLEFLPGVGIAFSAEPLGTGFALIVALLWFITVIYAIGYMRAHAENNQARFYAFFALSIGATIGAAFADNLLTLYLFYEILTLATYPLVTHGGAARDRAGGRVYLRLLLGTSLVFLLLAICWVYALTGTLTFQPGGILADGGALVDGLDPALLALLFALFVFGTGKAALMPFHRWLPAAMVAPTPVSALLHAVAVVKTGVFAILKVSVYTFGTGTLAEFDATWPIQVVAAVTLVLAAVRAMREDSLKRRLAYSTISQLAYVVLAATLANSVALAAGGLHIAAHAAAKITLFFCAGVLLVSLHKTSVSELGGVARQMPVTMAAWVVASLCIIGMPFTGGFWSKWYLARGALDAGEPMLLAVILLGSLLAVGYLLPPAVRAYSSSGAVDRTGAAGAARAEAPRSSLIALVLTASLSMLLFFFIAPLLRFLDGVVA